MREEGGNLIMLCIRRLRCRKCGKYHNELPDCLAPYKHYKSETICGVLDGDVTGDDLDSEDYPSESTMKRWKRWYRINQADMEGHLHRAALMLNGKSTDTGISLLQSIRNTTQKWLEAVLRIIYNSGGLMTPVY